MQKTFEINSDSDDLIAIRQGNTSIDYILGIHQVDLATIQLPDCPDIDPYNAHIISHINLLDIDNLERWLFNSFPSGKYFIKSIKPPEMTINSIQFGQGKVPSAGKISILFHEKSFYGIGVVSEYMNASGAVLLAICIPDFFVDSSVRCIVFVQIASLPTELCHLIIPHNDSYCLCLHDSFDSGEITSQNLKKWYERCGAEELIHIVSKL